ncbi:MAG TPA: type II toxin-antitoxin system VapC family toxin [Fimbriimonas sp.]|nr:type II toxin-antitoxin system VapC family toxin [Fimbriimonas sp.]
MSDSAKPIVVDATVLVKWYLPEMYSDECLRLLDSGQDLMTADVAVSQVASTFWKRVRTGELKAGEARRIVANLTRLPIRFVPMSVLAPSAMELSSISTRTFNESLYLVLAMREETRLVTADHRWHTLLATGKLKGHIELVTDAVKRLG